MNNRDYIGNTVNNWTILDFEQDKHGGKWLCRCTCGEEKWQKVYNVKNGKSKMCRKCSSKKRNKSESKNKKEKILKIRFDNHKEWTEENTFVGTYKEYLEECKKRREKRKQVNKYIPYSYDRLYKTYQGMKERCYNINSTNYKNYGERGIKVCDEWLKDYKIFKKWATNNGYTDKLTIDRIDVNGNYEPSNCRWATIKEQQRNRRNNVLIENQGKIKTLAEWSEITGISSDTIRSRLKKGIKGEELFYDKLPRKPYKKRPYEQTKKYQKDLTRKRRELATILKRVQIKKMLSKTLTTD